MDTQDLIGTSVLVDCGMLNAGNTIARATMERVKCFWKLKSNGVLQFNRATQNLPGKGLVETLSKTDEGICPITIPSSIVPVMKEYVSGHKPNQKYLFSTVNDTSMAPRNVLRHFQQRLEKLGLPVVTFHSLRHLHPSILALANVHPKAAQSRLGHATMAMTMDTYSHLIAGMDEQAADEIDKVF